MDLGIDGLSDLEEIGRGGSSVVYKAWQAELARFVAVKVIHASADDGVRRRFEREREAMGRLSEHPGIAQVHSTGQTRTGEHYLVMPFYTNGTLADRISGDASLDWHESAALMQTVGATLADAHDQGIVHRDVKPANILFSSADEPRVADFGISLLTSSDSANSTTPSFTPYYAAPEAFQTAEADATLDVYSLGATLYALLSGRPPFRSSNESNDVVSVMGRAANESATALENVPFPLTAFVARCMAKDPEDRPADGREFVAGLATAIDQAQLDQSDSTISPDLAIAKHGATDTAPAPGCSKPLLAIAAAVVALAVGLAVVFSGDAESDVATQVTVPGAPRLIGLDVVDITDTTARVVYRGDVCSGTTFVIEGLNQGGSGYPDEDRCWDTHQLLLGRPFFTPGPLLDPDTEYTISAVVYDEEGRASTTESVTFKTDELYDDDREVEISGLNVSEQTATSAVVFFATDLCAGSRFFLDGEQLHADGYPDSEWCWNQHKFEIGKSSDPLEPNRSYVISVEAYSRSGVRTVAERAFTTTAE